jgi:zinc transporter, ZIP family
VIDYFTASGPVAQAFMAGLLTWAATLLGAALVFVRRQLPAVGLDAMLGFAAGIMIAASFWSLLMPAIDLSTSLGHLPWGPPAVGFLCGGLFLRLADQLLPHLHPGLAPGQEEGVRTSWQRATLLVLAITLHNVPEGLALGVAFGAASLPGGDGVLLASAVALTIGIALQNFPEGVAVAMPLRREGLSRAKCFWYGQLSAVVEPAAAVVGAMAVVQMQSLLPYALSFAAGAMIYVVVEELIPESQQHGHSDVATLATLAGFVVMMILDVGLGA